MALEKPLNAESAPVAVTSVGDKFTWYAPQPVNILQIGFIVTIAAGTGTLAVAWDRIPANGGTRGDGDVGSLSKAAASLTLGKVVRKRVSVRLDKGDGVAAQVTTALSTAGTGVFYILYQPAGEATVEYDRATPPVAITIDSD